MSNFYIFTDNKHYYNLNMKNYPFFSPVHPMERLEFFTSQDAADSALAFCKKKIKEIDISLIGTGMISLDKATEKIQSIIIKKAGQRAFEHECVTKLFIPFLRG